MGCYHVKVLCEEQDSYPRFNKGFIGSTPHFLIINI